MLNRRDRRDPRVGLAQGTALLSSATSFLGRFASLAALAGFLLIGRLLEKEVNGRHNPRITSGDGMTPQKRRDAVA